MAGHPLRFVLSVKSVKSVVNSVFGCVSPPACGETRATRHAGYKLRHLPIEAGQVWTYPFRHGKDQSIGYGKRLSR